MEHGSIPEPDIFMWMDTYGIQRFDHGHVHVPMPYSWGKGGGWARLVLEGGKSCVGEEGESVLWER